MRYRRNEGVSVTTVDDGSFIVEPESQDIFYLDALAGGVWNALEEPMDVAELKALLVEAFPDAPAAQVAADLDALLSEMVERKLLLTQ